MKTLHTILADDETYGMANVPPEDTGLPAGVVVFVSPQQGQHGPRIKVSNTPGRMVPTDTFSVTIEDHPQVVGQAKFPASTVAKIGEWVVLNKEVLMRYWNTASTNYKTKDMLNDLRPLS